MAQAPLAQIVGLKALQRDLRKMSDPAAGVLAKALAQAGKDALGPVADAVRNAYPSRTGALRGTVRVTGSRTGAAVRVGSKKLPYAGPVDFGGYPEGRPYVKDGRYLYPTAQAHTGAAVRRYEQAVTQVCERFPWTNTATNPGGVHD
jgi:hypothetical protein